MLYIYTYVCYIYIMHSSLIPWEGCPQFHHGFSGKIRVAMTSCCVFWSGTWVAWVAGFRAPLDVETMRLNIG